MILSFDKEWEYVVYVWLDEDDWEDFHCKCRCNGKEFKYLRRYAKSAEAVSAEEYGRYSPEKASEIMDEMVNQSNKLADFRQRAYRAALEGAKDYIKTMGEHRKERPEKKDMMEAPDIYSLRVACHYYTRDLL